MTDRADRWLRGSEPQKGLMLAQVDLAESAVAAANRSRLTEYGAAQRELDRMASDHLARFALACYVERFLPDDLREFWSPSDRALLMEVIESDTAVRTHPNRSGEIIAPTYTIRFGELEFILIDHAGHWRLVRLGGFERYVESPAELGRFVLQVQTVAAESADLATTEARGAL